MTLFIATFSTLIAIINPLEALPVFLELVGRKDEQEREHIARRACLYAVALMFFFLIFGSLILRIFGIPLSMVRIVGGIILTRLGFALFSARAADAAKDHTTNGQPATDADAAFVPLAMPIMVGPGAIATILGMTSLVKQSEFEVAAFAGISAAIVATADFLSKRIVLIDGEQLTKLMIRHNVGCRVEEALHIKKIDEDFFESR